MRKPASPSKPRKPAGLWKNSAAYKGAYLLEGGKRLYYVLAAHEGMVALENCLYPDEAARWLEASELKPPRWRRVKPE